MQFDNIEHFCKKNNKTPTECTHAFMESQMVQNSPGFHRRVIFQNAVFLTPQGVK